MPALTSKAGVPVQPQPPPMTGEVLIVKLMPCAFSSIWVWWIDNSSLYLHMTAHTCKHKLPEVHAVTVLVVPAYQAVDKMSTLCVCELRRVSFLPRRFSWIVLNPDRKWCSNSVLRKQVILKTIFGNSIVEFPFEIYESSFCYKRPSFDLWVVSANNVFQYKSLCCLVMLTGMGAERFMSLLKGNARTIDEHHVT